MRSSQDRGIPTSYLWPALVASCLAWHPACSDSHDDAAEPENRFPGYGDFGNAPVTGIGTGSTSTSSRDDGINTDPDSLTGDPVVVGTPSGGGEVCFSDTLCATPDTSNEWCEREGGPVDLIYVDGVVVKTICYPPSEDPNRPVEFVDGNTPGDIDIVQNANRTTVIFSDDTNGVPIEGDIQVDGNNVAIFGNGADNTIIDGDVTLDGNNARMRGVTITGDLILSKNNVAIVLSRILGNVRLSGTGTNNSVFAENDIFGDFTSSSNGHLIVGNDVSGEFSHTGQNLTCDRNRSFTDEDEDQLVDEPGEIGGPLSCGT
jgi:hypothetical protein